MPKNKMDRQRGGGQKKKSPIKKEHIMGAVAGGIVGAAAGALLADKETRQKLTEKTKEFRDKALDAAQEQGLLEDRTR